ncbi:MAG: mannose-6-phosphate isomerase [bacterium]|nr:mannose-6-phosphate isomerase [bacterium]
MTQKLEKGDLYPLLFEPIYKEVMWGGNKLASNLDRELPQTEVPIGESWEIVDRDGDVSIAENGPLKGKNLRELIETYGHYLVGEKFADKRFPLLIKIIDAGKRLSLQVHPDKNTCRKIPNAEPKTEMWYIMSADKDAKIFAGLNHKSTMRRFMDTYQSTVVEECLQVSKSVPGDAYFITSGTVHAIGAGNLLLEIQQNSDTTFRISDWGRVGADGKPRELHVDEAMQSIHFTQRTSPKISGVIGTVTHNRKFPLVQYCQFFHIDDLRLAENWNDNTGSREFHIITAVSNDIKIGNEKIQVEVKRGRNCLIPAAFGKYTIFVKEGSETTVIKTKI